MYSVLKNPPVSVEPLAMRAGGRPARGVLLALCLGVSGAAMMALATPASAQLADPFSTATGAGSLAIGGGPGHGSSATANDATALGSDNQASGEGSVAIGTGNVVDNAYSGAVGADNSIVANGTIGNYVYGSNNIFTAGGAGYNAIIGSYNTHASGSSYYNSIIGYGNNFSGGSNNNVAIIGTGNFYTAGHSANNTILGNSNYLKGNGSSNDNLLGSFNQFSDASSSTVVGNGNTVQSSNVMVLGNDVHVGPGFDGAVVLGNGSAASAPVATAGTTINGTNYGFAGTAPTSAVSVGAAGAERQVTNVAAGQISATSTDAVNGSQLNATNQAVGQLGSQLAVTNTAVTNLSNSVTSLSGDVSDLTNNINNGTVGLVQQAGGAPGNGAITIGAATGGTSIDISGTSGNRVISGVAAGVAPTDAVNVSQLASAIVAASSGGVQYDDTSKSSVTLNAGGQQVALNNVAAGDVSATSTAAVNGSQLYATNQQVAALNDGTAGAFRSNNSSGRADPNASGADAVAGGFGAVASGARSTAIGSGATASGTNSIALGYNSSDGGLSNVVSVGSVGQERQIVNVAAGTRATDAVNVGQLQSGLSSTLSQANAYTDSRFAALNYDLRTVRRRADAGTAAAMAIAGLPQAFTPGAGMIAGGFGVYRDQTAFAFGASKAMNDEHTIVKMGATIDSRGTAGANVGIGYQF